MFRWLFLVFSALLLALVIWLRGQTESFRYIVPNDAGDVLYATTFDAATYANDWSVQDRRNGTAAQGDDRLHLTFDEFTPRRDLLRSTAPYLLRDFDYRVQAEVTAGPLNNSFGVVFRQLDDDSYYVFFISSDGWYSVWRKSAADLAPFALSAWIPSDAIRQGVGDGAVNDLRVVAAGDTFRFFVNGEPLLLCVPDDPDGESTYNSAGECVGGTMQNTLTDATIPYGKVGVAMQTIIDGEMAAAFDNAVVLWADG
jgi:hypothetical protein